MYRVSKKNGPFNVFFVSFDEHDYQKLKRQTHFQPTFQNTHRIQEPINQTHTSSLCQTEKDRFI